MPALPSPHHLDTIRHPVLPVPLPCRHLVSHVPGCRTGGIFNLTVAAVPTCSKALSTSTNNSDTVSRQPTAAVSSTVSRQPVQLATVFGPARQLMQQKAAAGECRGERVLW